MFNATPRSSLTAFGAPGWGLGGQGAVPPGTQTGWGGAGAGSTFLGSTHVPTELLQGGSALAEVMHRHHNKHACAALLGMYPVQGGLHGLFTRDHARMSLAEHAEQLSNMLNNVQHVAMTLPSARRG